MSKIRLMFVFGTRPEAIKLAPVILKAKEMPERFEPIIVCTAQHRHMVNDMLATFGIIPHMDLNVMMPGQTLFHVTSQIVSKMESVLETCQPDVLVCQGDTTTTFSAALSGFYAGIKVAHIEAGLRTGNKQMPFPEEINRRITSVIADYHFAPTESARDNLCREGYDPSTVFVTGNTVIDALMWMLGQKTDHSGFPAEYQHIVDRFSKLVLITGHRRENFGSSFDRICRAFRSLAIQHPEVAFVYPVHLNPNVQQPVQALLSDLANVFLLPPLSYPCFCRLMQQSYFIITDSGGVQEEAPALGKPVLVTRQVTERPEAVKEGMVKLVGDDTEKIIRYSNRLITDNKYYQSMTKGFSPYGDGKASGRILTVLKEQLLK